MASDKAKLVDSKFLSVGMACSIRKTATIAKLYSQKPVTNVTMLLPNRLLFPVAILLTCFSVTGCSKTAGSKLVGEWRIAIPEKVEKRIDASGSQDLSDNKDAGPARDRMSLTFSANGRLTTRTNMGEINTKKVGRWSILDGDNDTPKLKIRSVLAEQTEDLEVDFLDDNRIRLVPPNMAGTNVALEFVRK